VPLYKAARAQAMHFKEEVLSSALTVFQCECKRSRPPHKAVDDGVDVHTDNLSAYDPLCTRFHLYRGYRSSQQSKSVTARLRL
jgi:hypothetical protein